MNEFCFVLNTSTNEYGMLGKYLDLISHRCPNRTVTFWQGPFDVFDKTRRQNEFIEQQLEESDWGIICDVDEFHQFPHNLHSFFEDCSKAGLNCIRSQLVDRIASAGVLKEITIHESLEDQFPLAGNITQAIQVDHVGTTVFRGEIRKIAAVKKGLLVGPGHHFPQEESKAKSFHEPIVTNHYKWDALLLNRLTKRIEYYSQHPLKFDWYGEFVSVTEHLKAHRRINLSNIVARNAKRDPEAYHANYQADEILADHRLVKE